MTGADVLRQLREALEEGENAAHFLPLPDAPLERIRSALAALDGCILLTREEAEFLRKAFLGKHEWPQDDLALALLTPDEPQDDIERLESEAGWC